MPTYGKQAAAERALSQAEQEKQELMERLRFLGSEP
jgi:polyphosphate kinase